MPKQPKSEDT